MTTFDDILEFWFVETPIGPKKAKKLSARWFAPAPAFDAEVEKRFADDLEAARGDDLDGWCASARGRLALILMLDQFLRRSKRGTAAAFSGDEKALKLCRGGIGEGADRAIPVVERAFFYLPLMHAEELSAQLASVRLYESLLKESTEEYRAVLKDFLDRARDHREVVNRFGRFPHRNEVLQREASLDEVQFLRRKSAKLRLVERE
jgi:uncharacterized protein (DUF924 family)